MKPLATIKTIAVLLLGLCLAASPAIAGGPPADKGPPGDTGRPDRTERSHPGHDRGPGAHHADPLVTIGISFEQARQLALSNGYTGYSALPPGIRKNLARGKPLPPGLAKRGVPGPMLAGLPRYPGYEWIISGNDLVLVTATTAIIAGVLSGVFQ